MQGFYRNKYTTTDGKEIRYGASTQFEPADCRRAFPCWDEPNFKATFDITLITKKNLRAISNMVRKQQNREEEPRGTRRILLAPDEFCPMITNATRIRRFHQMDDPLFPPLGWAAVQMLVATHNVKKRNKSIDTEVDFIKKIRSRESASIQYRWKPRKPSVSKNFDHRNAER